MTNLEQLKKDMKAANEKLANLKALSDSQKIEYSKTPKSERGFTPRGSRF